MSQLTRFVATAVIAVIVTMVAMTFATRPAAAQSGLTSCSVFSPPIKNGNAQENWMAKQIASGRTHFVSIENGLCSW
jgi:hypothetical protein